MMASHVTSAVPKQVQFESRLAHFEFGFACKNEWSWSWDVGLGGQQQLALSRSSARRTGERFSEAS